MIDPSHATGKRWLVQPLAAGRRPRSAPTGCSSRSTRGRTRRSPTATSRSPSSPVRRARGGRACRSTSRSARSHAPARRRDGRGAGALMAAVVAVARDARRRAARRPRLRGEVRLPGDKSISHRALLLALLAEGESRIAGAGDGRDVRATAGVVRGARRDRRALDGRERSRRAVDYRVVSPGRAGLARAGRRRSTARTRAPRSGSLPGSWPAAPDVRRPRRRRLAPQPADGPGHGPARRRWARRSAGRAGATPAAARDRRPHPLRAIDHATPVPSAQVKSCLLLAGLGADGHDDRARGDRSRATTPSGCCGRAASRCAPRSRPDGSAVHSVDGVARVRPLRPAGARRHLRRGVLARRGRHPPGRGAHPPERRHEPDPACDHRPAPPDGRRHRRAPRRRRRRHGRPASRSPTSSSGAAGSAGSRSGRTRSPRRSTRSRSSAWPRPWRPGRTIIRGVGELRHKESDRVAGIVDGLTALGARVTVDGDTIDIDGGRALRGAPVATQDDHRLAMTFAVAGLVAAGRDARRRAGGRGRLVSGILRRAGKGASMTKRVVLIGHPVAHSLSGAMQQAAFDAAGIPAAYELWDRAPAELPDAIAELRTDDFLGANVTIPHKEKVVALVDRTDRGSPRHRRRQHDHPRGQAARRPQHRRARLPGRARDAGRQAEDAADGGRPRLRRRCPGGRPRPDHRGLPADRRLQPPPPSRRGHGQVLRAQRRPHGAARDAVARVDHRGRARQDQGARQRDLRRAHRRRVADPGRADPARPPRDGPHLQPGRSRACCATRRRPAARSRTARSCCSTRARPRSPCGPASRPRST